MRSFRVASIADYAATSASAWSGIAAETVEMVPAPLVMQPNGFIQAEWQDRDYGQLTSLEAQSVHDNTSVAVRLRWASEKPETGGREGFPDGAAIAFPIKGEPVLWTMGNEDEPVQFIQWQAMKNKVRSVIAWGIGSSIPGGEVEAAVNAGWSQGFWTIVITRTLAGGAQAATLASGQQTQIGFAVWNGSNEERGGLKAVSADWSDFDIEA